MANTDILRLIGDDGKLVQVAFAATAVSSIPSQTWCIIVTKSSGTSQFGDLSVGEFYYNPTAAAITLTGETVKLLTLTDVLDITGWSLEFSADEIDVTVLGDTVKKYRRGKSDANGTIESVFMKGTTDQAGGFANYFMPNAAIDATGDVTYTARQTGSLYLLGYLDQDTTSGGITLATLMNIELFSFALPMNSGEAVKVSPKFRLTGSINPTLYRITAV